MNLVLVFLGGKIPLYLERNLEYLNVTFPDQNIWLISDLPSNRIFAERNGVNFFLCQNPRERWPALYASLNNKKNYRNGFWFNTKARLLVLEEFMLNNKGTSILHVEGDVWLAPNYPMALVKNIKEKFAYPLTSLTSGIASTMFIKDVEAANFLIKMVLDLSIINPMVSDVEILGYLWNKASNEVKNLPNSFPPGPDQKLHENHELLALLSKHLEKFGGLFDASTFGIHLTGMDPRNQYGIREIYNPLPGHAIDINTYEFIMEDDFPVAVYNGKKFPLFSLHIHSKDLRYFSSEKWRGIVIRRIQQRGVTLRYELVLSGLFDFIRDYKHLLVKYFGRKLQKWF